MLEPAVKCFRGAVAGAGPVEVDQHVSCPVFQRQAKRHGLGQRGGKASTGKCDQSLHGLFALGAIRLEFIGYDALVDAPSRLRFDIVVRNEQRLHPVRLFGRERLVWYLERGGLPRVDPRTLFGARRSGAERADGTCPGGRRQVGHCKTGYANVCIIHWT